MTLPPSECKVYTPPLLADAMVRAVGPYRNDYWLDPCMGPGAFIAPLRRPKLCGDSHDTTHTSGCSELRVLASLNVPHRRKVHLDDRIASRRVCLERRSDHRNQLLLRKQRWIGLHTAGVRFFLSNARRSASVTPQVRSVGKLSSAESALTQSSTLASLRPVSRLAMAE